ncbi:unnamed protein product [Allacma fusca]|uniref:Uncharacterized protein n=1 Tax=Allacma fusca TaxID=39272 RepID=A0A8J2PYM2_9HEXA|nr:unnamed protein product [Allacma fusca]
MSHMEGTGQQKESEPKGKSKGLSINYNQLEANLQKLIEQDQLYWIRNDAKLRAVTQGTPTYEDFRQIVLAAHLKPVSKEEREELQRKSAEGKVIWNCAAAAASGDMPDDVGCDDLRERGKKELGLPRTSADLTKLWGQLENYDMKWDMLKALSRLHNPNTDENILKQLCREEVPPEIFPDLILCLLGKVTSISARNCDGASLHGDGDDEGSSDDVEVSLCILQTFSESKRFMLTLSFMGDKDRKNVEMLMEGLRQQLKSEDELDESRGKAKILFNLFHHIEARYSPQTTDS